VLAATPNPKLPQHRAVFALHLHATCLGRSTTIISGTGIATDFKVCSLRIFTGSIGTKGHEKFGKNSRERSEGVPKIFRAPI